MHLPKLLLIGLAIVIADLIWVGGIMPSTPAEGFRPWMNTLGTILFLIGIPVTILGLIRALKRPAK